MQQFKDLIKEILETGHKREDRTGFGTISIFGPQLVFDLKKSFPAMTIRPLPFKTMTHELLWFLKGTGKCDYLDDHNVKIWKEWTEKESNSIGPLYPVQLRNCLTVKDHDGNIEVATVDQLKRAIETLRLNPFSRRIVISYWNPGVLPNENIRPTDNVKLGNQALAPCHTLLQFYVTEKDGEKYLSSKLYQRSSDVYTACGFNVGQYALLTHLVAQVVGMKVDRFIWTLGDAHIYLNAVENAKALLEREPIEEHQLWINPEILNIDAFTIDDIRLDNYLSHPSLPKVDIAV